MFAGITALRLQRDGARCWRRTYSDRFVGHLRAKTHPVLRGKFMVSLHDYIEPGTTRRPAVSKLFSPRILTFIQS